MAAYFKCKNCPQNHLSPIAFGDKKSFETASLSANQFQCSTTKKMASYDKKDMFWKEDTKH